MTDKERVEALGGSDPPVVACGAHPFIPVEGNRYCGRCGGGILHPVHVTQDERESFKFA
jgi:hypothetical protein